MSNPINPLSKYQSYNYQQLLIVCDTTETAEALAATNQFLDATRSRNADRDNVPSDPYAKYKPFEINLTNGRQGYYVILINGMEDAEFVISKAHWYNSVAASAGGYGNQFSTLNAGGELTVNEPQGIRFMNVIAKAADNLGSDASGLIWMLKTVFVGHTSPSFESKGFPDPLTNIKPLLFFLGGLTGSFSASGGEYLMEFSGLNHGTTKQRHILKSADRIKINIASNEGGCQANTLAGALCKLQSRIGEIYDTYFQEMKDMIENTTDADGKKLIFNGREVTYEIVAESPLNGPEYLVTDFKDSATDTAETGKAGMIELSSEPSVEAAILAIAKRCPKIQDDLRVGDGTDVQRTRYITKVASTIQSTDTEYKIIYHLRRVVESRNDILQVIAQRTTDDPKGLPAAIRANIFELNYMYTGQNTDILEFDMKMQMGLALFQNLATTDNIPTSSESVSGTNAKEELAAGAPLDTAQTFDPTKRRPKTPIFLTTKVEKETLPHSTNAKRAIDFQELMNRHAALENFEAIVKIHGNPGLLNTVNKMPSEITSTTTFSDTQATLGDEENQDPLPYWETIPAIIRVNIKMPSVFYGGAINSPDYGEEFWYRGAYYCYAIEQTFEMGEFTQQLHMVSLPKNSPEENTQRNVSQTEQVQQTERANAANNVPGSGTTSGDVPVTTNEPLTNKIVYAGDSLDEHSGN